MASLSDLGWVYLALLAFFGAVFVAIVIVLARNARAHAAASVPPPPPATGGTLREAMSRPGAVHDPYVLRFVNDADGQQAGEAISMTDDALVVKREGAWHAVPLEQVHIEGDDLVARDVDWDAAKEKGEAWRAEQAAKHDALEFDAEAKQDE